MAEITAGMVKELREKTGLGDDGMQEGAGRGRRRPGEGRGDPARSRAGPRRARRPARVAAEGVVGVCVVARRQARRAGRSQLRDRLRGQERGLPRVRPRRSPNWSPSRTGRRRPRCRAALGGDGRGGAPGAGRKIGENMSIRRFARLQTQGRLASYVHGGQGSACWSTVGGDEDARQGSCHAHRRQQAGVPVEGRGARRARRSASARSRRREARNPASRRTSSRRWSRARSTSSSTKSRCSASRS